MCTNHAQRFVGFFTSDLALATGLQSSCFTIHTLEAGSIKVGLTIEGDRENDCRPGTWEACARVAQALQEQVADPKSVLRAGQITRHATRFDIQSPSLKADQSRADESPNALIMMVARIEEIVDAEQDARLKAEAAALTLREDLSRAGAEVTMAVTHRDLCFWVLQALPRHLLRADHEWLGRLRCCCCSLKAHEQRRLAPRAS